MILGSPLWMWAMPLASAPVVFHLLYRRRRQAIELPSLMFLHVVAPRYRARRRLREILVLCLRCLAIAAAITALARPALPGIGGGGSAAVVVAIDNSASMAATTGERNGLEAAVAGAASLIAALDAGDGVAVLPAVEDLQVPAPSGCVRDRAPARAALDALRPTQAPAAPARLFARAAELLQLAPGGRRELHLFTDAQTHDWGATAAATLPSGTIVTVHRIVTKPSGSAALAAVEPDPRALAGRPLSVHVALVNPGSRDAGVTVLAEDGDGRSIAAPARVAAGGHSDLVLALPGGSAGTRWVRVRLDGERSLGSDAGYALALVGERRRVVLRSPRQAGALVPALDPAGDGSLSGLLIDGRNPDPAGAALAIAAWDAPELERLRAWATTGGRLLLLPGAGQPPTWSGCTLGAVIQDQGGIPLIALDPGASCFRDLRQPDGSVPLGDARLLAGQALLPSATSRAWLGTADGRAVLTATPCGKGQVLTLGFLPLPGRSTLPLQPAFLALAQGLALEPAAPAAVRIAGEPPPLPADANAAVHLFAIAGPTLDWRGAAGACPPPPRAGVYVVEAAGTRNLMAVRADPAEADPARITGSTLPALGSIPHTMRDLGDAGADLRAARQGLDLTPWLIGLCLLLLALESWIANRSVVPA